MNLKFCLRWIKCFETPTVNLYLELSVVTYFMWFKVPTSSDKLTNKIWSRNNWDIAKKYQNQGHWLYIMTYGDAFAAIKYTNLFINESIVYKLFLTGLTLLLFFIHFSACLLPTGSWHKSTDSTMTKNFYYIVSYIFQCKRWLHFYHALHGLLLVFP